MRVNEVDWTVCPPPSCQTHHKRHSYLKKVFSRINSIPSVHPLLLQIAMMRFMVETQSTAYGRIIRAALKMHRCTAASDHIFAVITGMPHTNAQRPDTL